MRNTHIYKTAGEVVENYAKFFIDEAVKNIAKSGRFTVVLSGGSSPKKVFEVLATTYKQEIDWSKVFFFFGDERYVPSNDPESNALMAQKSLFEPLRIKQSQIFRVNTTLEPADAAKEYLRDINKFFDNQPAVFDLVMLGLGDDAHTASLFPETTALDVSYPTVTEVFVKDKGVYRITMSAPLINQAKEVAFLLYGESKANALQWVFEKDLNTDEYPAQLITRKANWFMDEAAASKLTAD